MPLRTVAQLLESGETPEVIREDHPNVPEEAYAFARVWAHAHPRWGRPALGIEERRLIRVVGAGVPK